MMSEENRQDPLAKVETERRDFLKKIAIAAAFAAPTIATFSVDGMRKKAFAQAQYDAPEVVLFDYTFPLSAGRAEVTFSQPMTMISEDDRARVLAPCRTTEFDTPGVLYDWAWSGDRKQVITYSGCQSSDVSLTVTYNQGGCGPKYVGANGVELLPFSGTIVIDVPGVPCG